MVQDPKRRRTAVQPQVPQKTSVIGEYDFASKSGPYVEREAWLQNQEAKGELSFEYVVNDDSDQALVWLTGLKNIYSRQLPNMPKEYIARLVLDPRHRSVALVKKKTGTPIGGITYRPFTEQGFAEIAFCAVTASEQVRGYGTRLMNHTKHAALSHDQCSRFLTYADNSAVGYFAKQGFTKEITLPKDVWGGFIKDYDGGTLMECVIHPGIPHTDVPSMVKQQKAALWAALKEFTSIHLVHAPPETFVKARREYEERMAVQKREAEAEGSIPTPVQFETPPIDPASIPGLPNARELSSMTDEGVGRAGYLFQGHAVGEKRDVLPTHKFLHIFMQRTWDEMAQHKDAWPFLSPVDANEVPDYYAVIKDPMDLATIERRIHSGTFYRSLEMFAADFRTIFRNCRFYNAPETVYYKAADSLEKHLERWIKDSIIVVRK